MADVIAYTSLQTGAHVAVVSLDTECVYSLYPYLHKGTTETSVCVCVAQGIVMPIKNEVIDVNIDNNKKCDVSQRGGQIPNLWEWGHIYHHHRRRHIDDECLECVSVATTTTPTTTTTITTPTTTTTTIANDVTDR